MAGISTKNYVDLASTVITCASDTAAFPLNNLKKQLLGARARFNPSAAYLEIFVEFAVPQIITTVGFAGLMPEARAFNELGVYLTVSYKATTANPSFTTAEIVGVTPIWGASVIIPIAPVTAQVVRILIAPITIAGIVDWSAYAFVDLLRIWCGNLIEFPEGVDTGWRISQIDASGVEISDDLAQYSDRRIITRTLSAKRTLATYTEGFGRTAGVMQAARELGVAREGVFFLRTSIGSPATATPIEEYENAIFGRFTQLPTLMDEGGNTYENGWEFKEIPVLLP